MKKILITGAKGFIGSHVVRHFKNLGYQTYGIGHGDLLVEECEEMGLDYWYKTDVLVQSIKEINQKFDLIVHCGGSGSVGFSVEHPYEDFKKTVDGTLEVLEYIRLYNPNVHFIYPSSPAVQGECEDEPIKEDYVGKPASPYGYHKKIAEDLAQSYSDKYAIKVSIIRLFSVYGNGLEKQLLWDASHKLLKSEEKVEFWGTGEETRDFIHVSDVLKIMESLTTVDDRFTIVNGGTGVKYSIKEVVTMIKALLSSLSKIEFNQQVNEGNPIYYWADIEKLKTVYTGSPKSFEEGLLEYIGWIKKI